MGAVGFPSKSQSCWKERCAMLGQKGWRVVGWPVGSQFPQIWTTSRSEAQADPGRALGQGRAQESSGGEGGPLGGSLCRGGVCARPGWRRRSRVIRPEHHHWEFGSYAVCTGSRWRGLIRAGGGSCLGPGAEGSRRCTHAPKARG